MTQETKKQLAEFAFQDIIKFILTVFIGVISYVFVSMDNDLGRIQNQISQLTSKVDSQIVKMDLIDNQLKSHEDWINIRERDELNFYKNKLEKK